MVEKSELMAHVTELDLSSNRLTEGVGRSLLSFAHACTALTQLNMDETFLTHEENHALTAMLARNVSMLPKNATDIMKEDIERQEERAAVADEVLAQLATEKKELAKVNAKVEMLRQKTSKQREDGINEYIKITNSIAQAKITISSHEEKIRQLERDTNFKSREYNESIAARARKLDAELEGKAWQLSIRQNLKNEMETVRAQTKRQMQHLLNDMDALCTKKEFAIKKHQKFRNDLLELLKKDEKYLEPRAADAAWDLLDADPTLLHEERLQEHRATVANRLLALETRERNQESMLRVARRAGVMYKHAEAARKKQEEESNPLSKLRHLFKSKEETEAEQKKRLLGKMSKFRRTYSGASKASARTGMFSRAGSADSSTAGNNSRLSQSTAFPASLSRDASRDLSSRGSPAPLSREVSREMSRDLSGMESSLSQTRSSLTRVGTELLDGIKEDRSDARDKKSRKSPSHTKKTGRFLEDSENGADREASRESVSSLDGSTSQLGPGKKKKGAKSPKRPSTTPAGAVTAPVFEPDVPDPKAQSQIMPSEPLQVPWSLRHLESMIPGAKLPELDLDSKKQDPTSAPTAGGPAREVGGRRRSWQAGAPPTGAPPAEASDPLGLKWENIGRERPFSGTEISNKFLAAALRGRSQFTEEEFTAFKVSEVTASSYIQVDDDFFRPATATPAEHVQAVMTAMKAVDTKDKKAKGKGKGKGKLAKTAPALPTQQGAAPDSGDAPQPQEGAEGVEDDPAAAQPQRRQGPKSQGICGPGSVKMLLRAGGQVDSSIMRGLLDVQQRYLTRINFQKGAWMTQLESQQEQRRPLSIGFMEAKRMRRLAQLQESLGKDGAPAPAAKGSKKNAKKEDKKREDAAQAGAASSLSSVQPASSLAASAAPASTESQVAPQAPKVKK